MNVRNTTECTTKRKPDLKPYSDVDDERCSWLDEFLDYFALWNESIEERPGNHTRNAKSNMFISWQTYEGLQITVHAFKECCRYLLQNNVPYVLSERFCQDDIENYFGRQRAIGRRRDNPSLKDVRSIAGNVTAGSKFNINDDQPLLKRKRSK